MNSAISAFPFYSPDPAERLTLTLNPLPRHHRGDDDIDDIQFFRSLDSPEPPVAKTRIPGIDFPVLKPDRLLVPTSVIRRIERELKNNECDMKTVFSACRGLARGTCEFEEAYISARIRSFATHRKISTDSFLATQMKEETQPRNFLRPTRDPIPMAPPNPMAVIRLGHLMAHFGIWVVMLFAVQVWSAWRISALAHEFLEGGHMFYLGISLGLMMVANSWVWFTRRGGLCAAFQVPGVVLLLMAAVPAVALHLRNVVMALH